MRECNECKFEVRTAKKFVLVITKKGASGSLRVTIVGSSAAQKNKMQLKKGEKNFKPERFEKLDRKTL